MFDEDQQAVEEQFLLLNYVGKKKIYKEAWDGTLLPKEED